MIFVNKGVDILLDIGGELFGIGSSFIEVVKNLLDRNKRHKTEEIYN